MKITIVIPIKKGKSPKITLNSLRAQSFQDFYTVIIRDVDSKGACWARNEGFKSVKTEFVLFSDDDINWQPDALKIMYDTLISNPQASYCYGAYIRDGNLQGDCEFNINRLKRTNYISTMSLIRSKDFCGFDINIKRLQDWDLWLTLLEAGKTGIYCSAIIYETKSNIDGISSDNNMPYFKALKMIRDKHYI